MRGNNGRSYTFAVLLILAGTLLLLDQLGLWKIPWAQIWPLWPLVLVLIGLEILLRRVPGGGWLYLLLAFGLVALVVLLRPGLKVERASLETRTVDYPLESVRSATLHITMGVGTLEIGPLQEPNLLYQAMLHANPQRTDLAVSNVREGEQVRADLRLVSRGQGVLIPSEGERLEVYLTPHVPVALSVEGGVSRSRLDLTGLNLSRFDLKAGVGEIFVALAPGDYTATIEGGVGKLTILLPSQAGAHIEVQEGLGDLQMADRFRREGNVYTAEGAGEIRLRIEGGVGAIEVK